MQLTSTNVKRDEKVCADRIFRSCITHSQPLVVVLIVFTEVDDSTLRLVVLPNVTNFTN